MRTRTGTQSTFKRIIICFICMLMMFCVLPVSTASAQGKTVTVAYIDYNSFIEKEGDGTFSGYGVDYLNKIAKYTGWEYEFVSMDWPGAYEAVKNGSIDFYCVARQTQARQADFDFSLYPVCNEEMNIYTLPEKDIYYEDFSAFDGMKVGMLAGSEEINYFNSYAAKNGFSCQITEYPMNESAVEALKNKEVDAIALVNYSVRDAFKLIGNFGVSPAYMMSCEGSPYMSEFSEAQQRLFFDEPTYTQTLENEYYAQMKNYVDIRLTREEADYIKNAPILTVAISDDMAPIEYYDSATNSFKGLSVDIYNRIASLTGLRFTFVKRSDTEKLIEQMENGDINLIGALAQNEEVEKGLHLKQTKKFTDNSFTLVAKDTASLSPDSVAAVPAGYPQFAETAKSEGYTNIKEYASFDACLNAVRTEEADLTYIISMCENYLLNHARYSDLQTVVISDTGYGVCFGVSLKQDTEILQSVINKCLAVITEREIDDLIVANTSLAQPRKSFSDFMAKYGVIILVCAVIAIAYIAFTVIRNQKSKQQLALNKTTEQHRDFLQHLYNTLPCGILRYSYEAPHRILSYNAACAKIYGYEDGNFPIVEETPDVIVEKGTEEAFREKFDLCEKTGPIIYVWPVTKKDGSLAYTESVMDLVDTDEGKVFQEVIIDVTERIAHEKQVAARYELELTRSGSGDKNLLYTACFDVEEQILVQTDINVPNIHVGMSVEEFVKGLEFELRDTQTKEFMEDFTTRFTKERLGEAYENGQYEQSFDLCRINNGQIQWLRSELALRLNPATGHLMCFDYIHDITDEHITNEIMRRLALADCESFMSVFGSTKRCIQYKAEKNGELTREDTLYAQNDIIYKLTEQMTKEAAEKFLEATSLSVIEKKLDKTPYYQVYATLWNKDKARSDKAVVFFYTNRENRIIAVTVSDVTEIKASEVRHAKLLSDALEAAEKADEAKSMFLSRVSHEMRTPLNAIIGFIELAKDADEEKTADYLASSDIAAKQLLSVINDVLDMSSIESGKLKIANSSFNFKHLISSITNIYGMQCKQKGIAFETKITSPLDDWVVGDELRVNQILMNLLGNAVKFTSEGHIRLTVSENTIDDEKTFIRFMVSDSGCGMSEEMMERLFKPFEQESASTARKYGGSGLGLSIVKNLVGMMGGKIKVESKQGAGTDFTVDLPFNKSDVNKAAALPKRIEELRILAIDDEINDREYMSLVLKRMGVRYSCVESGEKALAELKKAEKENDMYNVCLIDWKMPDMNGLDTTSKIREQYGSDVVVIVVSAYDFQHTNDSAKKAGANMFLSKPIFQSSLFDMFMTLTGGEIAKPNEEIQRWDFTGKRILLVEDNVLNQIVAKGYLAKYNATTDLAEDGQQAVDMFESSEEGCYDAILMDIQMPVMDGFEATKAIRESAHPQAKSIQIIAQTADAFNEDIAKCLSAGMNAHVSKPIKPDLLAKTLYKAFYG